ncbi:MAG TPA: hypothetical protein PKZ83_16660 [bacterium]|mgnify:CR=1 FL=1|nr:hypothetical protein [bacterium]
MKPEEKKSNSTDVEISPVLPLLLVGSMVLGLIILALEMFGVF